MPARVKTHRSGKDETSAVPASPVTAPTDAEITALWRTAIARFRSPCDDGQIKAECMAFRDSASQLGAQLRLASSEAQGEQHVLRTLDLLDRAMPGPAELHFLLPSLLGNTGLQAQLSVRVMERLLELVRNADMITPLFMSDARAYQPLLHVLLRLADARTPAASLDALLRGVETTVLEEAPQIAQAYMQSALKALAARLSTPLISAPQADCIARCLLRVTPSPAGRAPWAALPARLSAQASASSTWPFEVLDAACQRMGQEAASHPELCQAAIDTTTSILKRLDRRHADVYARIEPGSRWRAERLAALKQARHGWELALIDLDARTDFVSQHAAQRLKASIDWYDKHVAPRPATGSAPADLPRTA
jgi:hypothetical protein